MQFLDKKKVLEALSKLGLVRHEFDDRVRFTLDDDEDSVCITLGPERPADSDEHIEVGREELPDVPEKILGILHVGDQVLIPVGKWKDVLDAAAFDLCTDPHWLEIDAEASLHGNGRDPLLVDPDEHGVVRIMCKSIFDNAEVKNQDLTLVSLTYPIVLDIRHTGVINLWCRGGAVADEVRSHF